MTQRLGLRAQLVVALLGAFTASFVLLSFVAVGIIEHARSRDLREAAAGLALATATALDASTEAREETFHAIAERLVGTAALVGMSAERPGMATLTHGRTGRGRVVEAPLGSGGKLRMWFSAPTSSIGSSTRLLLLYFALTAVAILLLTYVALTRLIVRPIELVTRASERLAEGGKHVQLRVSGAGEVVRLAGAFNDMAGQLRADRASLEQRLRELEKTTQELESAQQQVARTEKLASVGRLAAGVAHEIGNPLTSILGLVELLRSGDLGDTERDEFLRRIHKETERIHRIIRDLLDFSRRGGEQEVNLNATSDVREIVEDAVRLIAPQKDLRGVTIERRFADDTPQVRGEGHRLTQVVLNLLLNAADAINGEGTIWIEVHPAEDGDDKVVLVVADSGPGIAPEVMHTLFDPFVTTKAVGTGTGLGLSVCHTIIEDYGGTITASNPSQGGARFEVKLPKSVTTSAPAPARV